MEAKSSDQVDEIPASKDSTVRHVIDVPDGLEVVVEGRRYIKLHNGDFNGHSVQLFLASDPDAGVHHTRPDAHCLVSIRALALAEAAGDE